MSDATEYFALGGPAEDITPLQAEACLARMLDALGTIGRALLIPPDHTRGHSAAGEITVLLRRMLMRRGANDVRVLPALGTHIPMTPAQKERMFPGVPAEVFVDHRWRTDLEQLGEVPGSEVARLSGGRVDYSIRCEVNQMLVRGGWDRIFSIGQLVPHEVVGIANQNKNVFIGTGGKDTIDKSHFLGAVCGMESIMGRAETPVRAVLDYMSDHFGAGLPITYLLTVRERAPDGRMVTRGFYGGDGKATYRAGAELSRRVNVQLLDRPLTRVVAYLDEEEFHSTWLGNKAIYRTRMAIADAGELIILAPGVRTFGEDPGIDALIRQYGYRTTPEVLGAVASDPGGLGGNLSAAAHLIHGSSEGRFRITYCPGGLTREEVENVGYAYRDLSDALREFDPARLRDGWNEDQGVFFVRNPALGLWALRDRMEATSP